VSSGALDEEVGALFFDDEQAKTTAHRRPLAKAPARNFGFEIMFGSSLGVEVHFR
jgi:hypothetical protein